MSQRELWNLRDHDSGTDHSHIKSYYQKFIFYEIFPLNHLSFDSKWVLDQNDIHNFWMHNLVVFNALPFKESCNAIGWNDNTYQNKNEMLLPEMSNRKSQIAF